MFSVSEFIHDYDSPFRHRAETSSDYGVTVNGRKAAVYTCRISEYPFNRVWPGFQRPVNQSEICSFVNITGSGKLDFNVRISNPSGEVVVKPRSKAVKTEKTENGVRFTLSENGNYVLFNGSYHRCLYIFYSKEIPCENESDATYYFGAGVHFAGKITLHDNESVYIDKNALVYGNIYAENAKNLRIFGNGVLDGSGEERFDKSCYENYTNGNVKFYDCENVKIEGVLLKNSAIWCVNLFHCFSVDIEDVKIFGQWRYNTDGIDVVNCSGVKIRNAFVHSFDDAIAVKGIERYKYRNVKDISVENCVLWCDWGKTLEIGLETRCDEISDVTFINCDVIRGGNTVCDIQNGDYAFVHNIKFENIRVDVEKYYTPEEIQTSDDARYQSENRTAVTNLFSLSNRQFISDEWEIEASEKSLLPEKAATATDVSIKNASVYIDERIEKTDGRYNVPIVIRSVLKGKYNGSVTVENFTVNGTKINAENAVIDVNGITEFVIK